MADVKISGLPASTTPLAGTEVLPIVQGSQTRQVSVNNLTAGKAVSALSVTATNLKTSPATANLDISGSTVAATGTDTNIDINVTPKGTGILKTNNLNASALTASSLLATDSNKTLVSVTAAATTPLAGTEEVAIVQSGSAKKATVANITGAGTYAGSFTTLQNVNLFTNYQTATIGGTAGDKLDFERDVAVVGGTAQQLYTILYRHTTGSNFIGTGYRLQNRADATDAAYIGWGSPTEWNDVGMYNSTGNGIRISTAGNAIVNTGNLVIGTSGKGIDFSATAGTGTSELLADYEEGTWLAVISDGTTDATMGFSSCQYTKIGRQVTVCGFISTTDITGITGNLIIKGLPFTVANGLSFYSGGSVGTCGGLNITANQVVSIYGIVNTTTIDVRLWDATTGTTGLTPAEWSADGSMVFSLTYFV